MDTVSNTIKGIFSFDNGLDLDKITEIFAIDSIDTSDTKINISFDTSKLGYDIGNIKVTVDVANDAIDVAVTGLTFNDTTISLNLKTIDYVDPSESLDSEFDPESYIQVNEFHNFINGLFDMVTSKEQKYGVSLNATLASTAEKDIHHTLSEMSTSTSPMVHIREILSMIWMIQLMILILNSHITMKL